MTPDERHAATHPDHSPAWSTNTNGKRICRECQQQARTRSQARKEADMPPAAKTREPMTRHLVASIIFVPRSNDGPMTCSCGWTGEYRDTAGHSNTFSEHRAAAGARPAHFGHNINRTDDSPAFVKRLSPSDVCHRGHEGQWRPRSNGKRECGGCTRETQTIIRQRQREARVA